MNNAIFLKEVYTELEKAKINVWIFGGWAEELHKTISPSDHKDIDLLYPAEDFLLIDTFIKQRQLTVIKHFPHKRAFLYEDIMVELFLVIKGSTYFFSTYQHQWPQGTFTETKIWGMRVSSKEALKEYRKKHYLVEEASRDYFK